MDSIVIGIILLIIGGILFILFVRRKSRDEEDALEYIDLSRPSTTSTSSPVPLVERQFSLAELKRAEAGRYSWDETGCVFEINSDGSVTVVGRFDPAELHVDPVQEMFERLNNDGLFEMLPRMWSFHAVNNGNGENDTFVMARGDDILSVPACPHTIDEVKNSLLIPSSFDGGKSVITFILSKTGEGVLILMPSNEKEYILSLGAKACVERAFGDKVKVRISSPAVMGAFGIAIARHCDKLSKISFAFGEDEDYMCCNLLAEDGVYEVQQILRSSIIQPAETFTALHHIAKGCMVQSLIREGHITDYLLIDMLPYTISLLLKENDRVIKIYDLINEPATIPIIQGDKDINIESNQALSFLIGSNELIYDIVSEYNTTYGNMEANVEIDVDMSVMMLINTQGQTYSINVGELIG